MGKLEAHNGMSEPFTMIPNRIIRSKMIKPYDKLVFCCIASCGGNAFPSYEKIMDWTGLSRDSVWKSLRALERVGVIERFKLGVKVVYRTHWNKESSPQIEDLKSIRYADESVRNTDGSVCYTDSISPPGGRISVRNTDPIKNPDKELLKIDDRNFQFLGSGSRDPFADPIEKGAIGEVIEFELRKAVST